MIGGVNVGVNSYDVNEGGQALCCVCRKKKSFSELADKCTDCGRWVCKECSSYQRQLPFGYICKNCQKKK